GRQESAEGHAVLHRAERPALHAHRALSRGRRQVHVRLELSQLSSRRKAGPTPRIYPWGQAVSRPSQQRRPVVMGPGSALRLAGTTKNQNTDANSLAPGWLELAVIRLSVIASSFATVLWRIATGLRS